MELLFKNSSERGRFRRELNENPNQVLADIKNQTLNELWHKPPYEDMLDELQDDVACKDDKIGELQHDLEETQKEADIVERKYDDVCEENMKFRRKIKRLEKRLEITGKTK